MNQEFLKRKCKITFIRHGATVNTEENRMSDNESFPPLSDCGKREIKEMTDWIKRKGLKINKIYAGPALRNIQTAEAIGKVFETDFEIMPGFGSRKWGIWSGLDFDRIEKKYPELLEKFRRDPENNTPEGAESLAELNLRVISAVEQILADNTGSRLLVITHDEVIQAAVGNVLGLPLKNQRKIFIPTASATQISYYKDWASVMYTGYVPL